MYKQAVILRCWVQLGCFSRHTSNHYCDHCRAPCLQDQAELCWLAQVPPRLESLTPSAQICPFYWTQRWIGSPAGTACPSSQMSFMKYGVWVMLMYGWKKIAVPNYILNVLVYFSLWKTQSSYRHLSWTIIFNIHFFRHLCVGFYVGKSFSLTRKGKFGAWAFFQTIFKS